MDFRLGAIEQLTRERERERDKQKSTKQFNIRVLICIDNSLILHIYIIVRKHYHTYFEVIHAFHICFEIMLNNQFCA